MDDVTLIHGDCLVEMPKLPSASFDMICADLPYGTTACSWDVVIPFEPLWAEYKRLIKPRGAIVLFGSQPFTSLLVCSNLAWFKYAWVWDKVSKGDIMNAKNKPMKEHEDILIFSPGTTANRSQRRMTYNPIGVKRNRRGWDGQNRIEVAFKTRRPSHAVTYKRQGTMYPSSILRFSNADHTEAKHPTQKPVALLEYLILTYTDEGAAVLDNTMGSGTTLVACIKTGRTGTGIELRRDYFETAEDRCRKARLQAPLPYNHEMKLTQSGSARDEDVSSDVALFDDMIGW